MPGLLKLPDATLSERNQAKDYFIALLITCNALPYFRIISNPHHIGAVYKVDNPPNQHTLHQVLNRLDEKKLFVHNYCETHIRIVSMQGLLLRPMIEMTHINPKLLPHELKQELALDGHNKTLDITAYLPSLIQNYWRRFSPALRAHIMDCMTDFLEKHLKLPHHDSMNSFFVSPTNQHPSIPVLAAGREARELMEVLARANIEKTVIHQLAPGPRRMQRIETHFDHYVSFSRKF